MFNIARGAVTTLRIDPKTIHKQTGLYSRVLVDVDYSWELPEQTLVQRKAVGYDFFINVSYEKVPQSCHVCGNSGHSVANCRKGMNNGRQNVRPTQPPTGNRGRQNDNSGVN